MGGKQDAAAAQARQRRGVVVAGAALGTLVAVKLLLGLLRGKRRDASTDIKFRTNLTPSEILKLADDVIADSTLVHDSVAAVPLDRVSYDTVIEPLARLEAEEFARVQSCVFPSLVAPSKDVRDASTKAEKMLEGYNGKCRMREDVYRVVKAYYEKKEALQPEAQRYLEHLIRDYERLGLHLSSQERIEALKLKKSIGDLCISFQKNLIQESKVLLFAEEELAGVSPSFMKELEKGSHGKLKIPLDARHYFPIMQYCSVASTRKELAVAYDQRCIKENVPIFQKVVSLRHRLARLLGFPNHVEYMTAVRMAKCSSNVKTFLETLSVRMSPSAAAELQKLRALKRAEEGEEAFGMEDLLYYMHRTEEVEQKVDFEKLKEYFPLDAVINGVFRIYEDLLDFKFVEISNPEVWHPEVRHFSVDEISTNQRMGYFYLDLCCRDGKYGHACVCPLQPPCRANDGTFQAPVAALIANFTSQKPGLLGHSEVETIFHEFGHVMHHICSRPSFPRFSGLRVEDDFVEAPSKMLEKWCYQSSSLKLMSGLYKDREKRLPDGVCEVLVRKKRAHAGLLTKRQILLGLFDVLIHSSEHGDSLSLLEQLHAQIMEGIPMLQGTNLCASFSHLMGGYDGTYYSYLWSQVLSEDMFESKFKGSDDDMLRRGAGKEFREKILMPGATKDATQILFSFLGRQPSQQSFVSNRSLRS